MNAFITSPINRPKTAPIQRGHDDEIDHVPGTTVPVAIIGMYRPHGTGTVIVNAVKKYCTRIFKTKIVAEELG